MDLMPWVEVSPDSYVAEMGYGRAIVQSRVHPDNTQLYAVRLELPDGSVVFDREEVNPDLEHCLWAAFYKLPYLDQVEGYLKDCGLVFETLDWCEQALANEVDVIHKRRIESIKQWVSSHNMQPYELIDFPLPAQPSGAFEWTADGSEYHSDTPFGEAIISQNWDTGGTDRVWYQAHIMHPTGAALDCGRWRNFLEAEHALKRALAELGDPGNNAEALYCIDFTFDVCSRLLPPETEPIHLARLSALNKRLHFTLE